MKRYSLLLLIWPLWLIGPHTARSQDLLQDKLALDRLEKGLQLMYGYEFSGARQQFTLVQGQYPNHPATPLLDALMILWQHQPFSSYQSAAFTRHLLLLEKTVNLSEIRLAQNEDDIEGVFFKTIACGLLTQHYNDMGESSKAIGETKRLYALVKKSFALRSKNVELYFMTGLYNYYREYYPAAHPFYRPFAVFFKSGSKKDGLAELELVEQKSVFSASEAAGYLAHIYLRYENNPRKALLYARKLSQKYPNNLLYASKLAEILILTRNFEEALPYTQQLQAAQRPLWQAMGKVCGGMIAEFKQKNLEIAVKNYQETEILLKKEGKYADSHRLYVYAGLYRHYARLGNKTKANQYRQLAQQYDIYNYLGSTF